MFGQVEAGGAGTNPFVPITPVGGLPVPTAASKTVFGAAVLAISISPAPTLVTVIRSPPEICIESSVVELASSVINGSLLSP